MNIQFLQNEEIDKTRWDSVVKEYGNGRVYMLSQYLDACSENWSAVIFSDYQYIMALPFKSYGWGLLKKHYIPLFIQQLGIIGPNGAPNNIALKMIDTAQSKYSNFIHALNHENNHLQSILPKYKERTNYELNLQSSYQTIAKNYCENLKRNLSSARQANLVCKEGADWNTLETFIKDFSQPGDPTPHHINTLKSIDNIEDLDFSNHIYKVQHEDQVLAVCMAPRFKNRITLLIPRSSPKGRASNAMAFLIDYIIQKYQGQEIILDFEGSMLPGVAKFYRQFGPINKIYTYIF